MIVGIVLVVSVLLAFLLGGGLRRVALAKPLAGARADKWNAWRFPTKVELDHGADPWDLIFVGTADFPEDAREMLPEQGGQVQEGLTGPVTSYVNEEHELAQREIQRARERAARKGDDAA